MAPRVTLYVVRHGETDWNAERRYQGQTDIPMNEKGRAQAALNGLNLKRTLGAEAASFSFIASPLGRARETMEIVRAQLGLDPSQYRVEPALKELSYGHWEGILQSNLPALDPAGVAEREKDPFTWRPRGGESYADLLERSRAWLETVTEPAVIVAHGGTIRTLRALYEPIEPRDVPFLDAPQNKVLRLEPGNTCWL